MQLLNHQQCTTPNTSYKTSLIIHYTTHTYKKQSPTHIMSIDIYTASYNYYKNYKTIKVIVIYYIVSVFINVYYTVFYQITNHQSTSSNLKYIQMAVKHEYFLNMILVLSLSILLISKTSTSKRVRH